MLVLDGVSALDHIRLQEALYPIVSPHVCLCWMLCPPSRGLVPTCDLCWWCVHFPEVLSPPCLPLSPFLFPCVGWCVRLPEVFSPLSPSLSPSLFPSCLPACLPTCLPTCLSSCFLLWRGGLILHFFKQCTVGVGFLKVSALVLDGMSAFPRSCLLYCLPVCLTSCFPLWRVVSFCIFSQTVYG